MILVTPHPYTFMYKDTLSCPPFKYVAMEEKRYYSKRYNKSILVPLGYLSDGATDAPDINSFAWWVHDVLCDSGTFEDGTKCTNWQASMILKDILREEGRWIRDHWWFLATWLFGGGKARENGMI